jgi:hypothetical protein
MAPACVVQTQSSTSRVLTGQRKPWPQQLVPEIPHSYGTGADLWFRLYMSCIVPLLLDTCRSLYASMLLAPTGH